MIALAVGFGRDVVVPAVHLTICTISLLFIFSVVMTTINICNG